MRKVKFMLDWKDSRATEFRLGNLRVARETRDCTVADSALAKDKTDPFDMVQVPKEPLSEEEQQVSHHTEHYFQRRSHNRTAP